MVTAVVAPLAGKGMVSVKFTTSPVDENISKLRVTTSLNDVTVKK
jgi:hypothetical protein